MPDPSEPPTTTPRGARSTTAATVAVGLMAAALSYDHMRLLAVEVGEPAWRAAVLPLTVDGLVVVATKVTVARRGAGRAVGWLAYTALVASVLASLAANVVSGDPTLVPAHVVRWVVSAWPPLAVAMAFELVLQYRSEVVPAEDRAGTQSEEPVVPGPAPVEPAAVRAVEPAPVRPHLVPAPGLVVPDVVDMVVQRYRQEGATPGRRTIIADVKAAGGAIGTTRANEIAGELRAAAEVAS